MKSTHASLLPQHSANAKLLTRTYRASPQAYNAEKAGAKAIIVADYKDERLLTMAVPEDRPEIAALKNDITIPTALITQVLLPASAATQ